jgi:hypothetical protein
MTDTWRILDGFSLHACAGAWIEAHHGRASIENVFTSLHFQLQSWLSCGSLSSCKDKALRWGIAWTLKTIAERDWSILLSSSKNYEHIAFSAILPPLMHHLDPPWLVFDSWLYINILGNFFKAMNGAYVVVKNYTENDL